VGNYTGGLLVLQTPRGPVVAAALGEGFSGVEGRSAPADLAATASRRLSPGRMLEIGEALGTVCPAHPVFLVPLSTGDRYVGTLALLDPDGETPDDRLLEAYGSRAATAFLHVRRPGEP
jgi:hypothetical protein